MWFICYLLCATWSDGSFLPSIHSIIISTNDIFSFLFHSSCLPCVLFVLVWFNGSSRGPSDTDAFSELKAKYKFESVADYNV